ncbi:PST family polysaccharide transporter [Pseudonocardia hierapolitana]|uniref:PST family polysaccharide transporter n=1 Tax=Pseudonocardia hierapolitana TaxID=1128676 RepID=A0A561SVT7_9PSEU|nr:oligosaccharide flippase family protein [Pseudonocardia hierapolitana]TWF78977.1 PST family polysaccharide transporter [Pseudonocardia hierapolitana]
MDTPQPGSTQLRKKLTRVATASAGAQFITQGVSLLHTIVLARLLSPAEVGIFAAGTVLTALLVEFSEGGLRAALVNRQRDVEAAAETVFWATLVSGVLISVGALAAAPLIGLVFSDSTVGLVAAASAGGLLLHSLTNVPEALLQREFSVSRNIVLGPAVSISFAVVAVVCAALGLGVWSLVIGTYASSVTLLVGVWVLVSWRPGRAKASVALWRQLARYGYPLLIDHVASQVRTTAEPVVIGRLLDTAALGFYRYGLRIARLPVNVMISVVAYALFPAFSHIAADPDRLRQTYLKALRWVTFCAAPVSGLMLAIGEPAAVVVLGEPWREAGVVLVAMAGLGIGKAFASVSEEAIKGCGRTALINFATAVEFALGLSLLVLIVPFGLPGVGLAISVSALVVGVLCLGLARSALGVHTLQIVRATLPSMVASLAATATAYALEQLVLHSDTRGIVVAVAFLVLDAVAFLVVYLAVLAAAAPSMAVTICRVARSRRLAGRVQRSGTN